MRTMLMVFLNPASTIAYRRGAFLAPALLRDGVRFVFLAVRFRFARALG
jgi:hypothetical protein